MHIITYYRTSENIMPKKDSMESGSEAEPGSIRDLMESKAKNHPDSKGMNPGALRLVKDLVSIKGEDWFRQNADKMPSGMELYEVFSGPDCKEDINALAAKYE